MLTRRRLLQGAAVTGATLLGPSVLVGRGGVAWAQPVPWGSLDPTAVPKYVTPLFVIPAMPSVQSGHDLDIYSAAARRFTQQMLPGGYRRTTALGFGSTTSSASF